jgi:hypothetical protein
MAFQAKICALILFFSTLLIAGQKPPKNSTAVPKKKASVTAFERRKIANDKLLAQTDAGYAMRFYALKRAMGPNKGVPIERYREALLQMRKMQLHTTTLPDRGALAASREGTAPGAAVLGTWSWLGPGNIAGRARTLLVDSANPDLMYTAGVAGGVFKSINAGASWVPISDEMANLAVTSLAFDPHDHQVIYAGTGEGFGNYDAVGGLGIFKTIDGGVSWNRLNTTGANWTYVNQVAVSSRDSKIIYAATNGGIMRSRDGGLTFSVIYAGSCTDLVLRTDLPDRDFALAGCFYYNGFELKSSPDASAAGSPQWIGAVWGPDFGRMSFAIAPSDQNIVYALISKGTPPHRDSLLEVLRSTDGGVTWSTRTSWTNSNKLNTVLLSNPLVAYLVECGKGTTNTYLGQGWYDNVIAVDPTNPNRVWAGGVDLFRSDDGGASWGLASYWWDEGSASYVHADQHAIVFHPGYNGTSNRTVFFANDGGIFRTDNALAQTATGSEAPCAASNSHVQFQSLNHDLGITQFYHGAAFAGGDRYFGGTQDNGTLKGTDSAGTMGWSRLLGGDGGFVAIDPIDSNILYASNPGLSLKKSVDGGQSWVSAVAGINDFGLFITPFALDPGDRTRLWTGGFYLWRSSTSGGSWDRASALTPGDGFVSALGVSPVTSNNVAAGLSDGFIAYTQAGNSTDTSTIWAYTRPRTGFVSSITYDPVDANTLYATYSSFNSYFVDAHVYKSTNGGLTWVALDGTSEYKLPDIPVHSLVISPFDRNQLYIGTDIGVFTSIDGGTTWGRENTGYINVVTESLALGRQGSETYLFAFTHGRGVWRTTLRNLQLYPSPVLLDFVGVGVGQTATRTITLTNRSTDPISVTGIVATGEFSQSNTCSTVAAGATCELQVVFAPLSVGSKVGNIQVTYLGALVPLDLQLRGRGVIGPELQVSSTALIDFGTAEVGRIGAYRALTLTNTGTSTPSFILIGFASSSEFDVSHDCVELAAQASCTLMMRFRPQAAGVRTDQLNVSCNSCTNPIQVKVTGTAIANTSGLISGFDPDGVVRGSAPTEVKVLGTGFTPESVIRVNGALRSTRYESATRIYFTPVISDFSSAQLLEVDVLTQGSTSPPESFFVYLPLIGQELVYDRFTQKLFAFDWNDTRPTVKSVDPRTGDSQVISSFKNLGRALTLDPGGRYLYYSYLDNGSVLVRYNLETGVEEKRFRLELVTAPQISSTPFSAPVASMAVSALNPRDLIIYRNGSLFSLNLGIAFYKDGVLQGKNIPAGDFEIFHAIPGGNLLYDFRPNQPPRILQFLDSTGMEVVFTAGTGSSSSYSFDVGQNTIYKEDGELLDLQTFAHKGRFFFNSGNHPTVVADEENGLTYFAGYDGIWTYANATGELLSRKNAAYHQTDIQRGFVLAGKDIAAMIGGERLRIFKRPHYVGPSVGQPTPRLDSLSPNFAPQRSHNLKVRLNGANFTRWSVVRWNGAVLENDFIDASTLMAYVPRSRFESLGFSQVTVENTGDGGLSGTLPFSVHLPSVAVTNEFLDFGSVVLGRSVRKGASFTNNTGAPLPFSIASTAAPFQIQHSCATPLPPLQSCSFDVSYAPSQTGGHYADVYITSAQLSIPLEIPVFGAGFDFLLVLTRPARPSRTGLGSTAQLSSATLSIAGTTGLIANLSCVSQDPRTRCLLSSSSVRLGDVGSSITVTASRTRGVQRLTRTNVSLGGVIVSATVAGETRKIFINF